MFLSICTKRFYRHNMPTARYLHLFLTSLDPVSQPAAERDVARGVEVEEYAADVTRRQPLHAADQLRRGATYAARKSPVWTPAS